MADVNYSFTAHEQASPTFSIAGTFSLAAKGKPTLGVIMLQRLTDGVYVNAGDVGVGQVTIGHEVGTATFRLVAFAPAYQGQAIALTAVVTTP